MQTANYTIPELTNSEYETIVNALLSEKINYHDAMKKDPVFKLLQREADYKLSIDSVIENPKLLPAKTNDGYDTADIAEAIREIKFIGELVAMLSKLEPHCFVCGKVTRDISTIDRAEPALCDDCLKATLGDHPR